MYHVSPELCPICVHSLPAPTAGQQGLNTWITPYNWLTLTFCPSTMLETARQKARRQSRRRPGDPAMTGGGWRAHCPAQSWGSLREE